MRPLSQAILSVLVFFAVFFAHFAGPTVAMTDSRWYIPTAMSMIKEGNANLDEYKGIMADRDYGIRDINGHIYNDFPIGVSVLTAPFVFAIEQTYSRVLSLDLEEHVKHTAPTRLETFIASLIVALTAVFIHSIARLFLNHRYSLLLVFIFAFCTSAWSTASRALWQHGPSMLMLTITLWLILLARDRPGLIQFASVPLAFSYTIRPTNSISVILLTVFVLVRYRQYFLRYLVAAMPVAVPFLLFNLSVYQSILAPYYLPQRLGSNPRFLEALAGNLVSPARGLLTFTPVLFFSVGGITLKIKNRQVDTLDSFLIGVAFLHWISISSFGHWWAGHSYGPRFFSDMIPFLVYFIIPVLARMPEAVGKTKVVLFATFSCLVAVSFLIHFRGVTSPDVIAWNREPADIDAKPARLWDWHDIQFLRGIEVPEPELRMVPLPSWFSWFVPNKTEFSFGRTFELMGYKIRTSKDNLELSVTLYWKAIQGPDFDYSVFLHLIDDGDRLIAQRDHSPGVSRDYPPTAWQPGDIIADKHTVQLPRGLPLGTYRFRLGVYNWATGERMQVWSKGQPIGDHVILDQTLYRAKADEGLVIRHTLWDKVVGTVPTGELWSM